MGKISELPKSASRLLTSSQIITSVYCVVKELIENALDGASKNVEVKLEDFGIEKIEVKDNGTGIDKNDIQFVAKPHFTSKITSYSDLEKVNTYGFRGEALGAICAVADLAITTKSSEEVVGYVVHFNHDGSVSSTKPCPCAQGSTVSAQNLFKNIPVRRQYYRSEKNKKDELRKVEELLIAYGCIQNDVRFALYHNKNLIWQKPALSTTKNALIQVLGNSVVGHLKYSEYVDEQYQRKIEMYLPSSEAPMTCGLGSFSRCITAINKRPVRMKAVDKLLKEHYNKAIQNTGKPRYPICFISFTIPLKEVDVNVEPNKTNVMLHHSDDILAQFSEILTSFYNTNTPESNQNVLPQVNAESNAEPKPSDFLSSLKANCDLKLQQTKLSCIPESPISISKENNLNIVNNHSVGKTSNSMSKKDIVAVGVAKEPNKKKLKTTVHASKNDVEDHINSLKKFFSEDKASQSTLSNIPPNCINGVPTVTVERFCPNQSSSTSEAGKLGNSIDSGRITTFAVSTNICSDNSSNVSGNSAVHRKRHFSDSSISNMKCNQDQSLKRPAFDANVQNPESAWSRGVLPSGELLQPVKILQPKTIALPESTPTKSSERVDEPKKAVSEQKNVSFERKFTAFDVFCRSSRLEVAAENPEFNNQQIAQVLSEKWNRLSHTEKAVYKNMLDKDYKQEVKKKEKLGKIVSYNLNQGKSEISPPKKRKKKIKHKIKEKVICFNSEHIKKKYENKLGKKPLSDDINIINYLAPGIWVCAKKKKLYLLNTFRLQETVIYHRLLETFQFDTVPLEKPQIVTTSHIGDENMEILMKLCKTDLNGVGNISDERLTANGFDMKLVQGMQDKDTVELIGLTSRMAFYGIPDLKELLSLIGSKGSSAKLSECRPGKVMLYLQGEANRISRQSPACQRQQDVEDLLYQNHLLLNNCNECIHHKPFFNELCNIDST